MNLRDAAQQVEADRRSSKRSTKTAAKKRPPPPAATTYEPASDVPWDERMKRHTFHIPIELIDELRAASKRTGHSHARIVRDALTAYLPTLDN